MLKNLIQLALFLVAGILIYNYFFGTNEEQEQSKEVFQKTGAAVKSAWNLLKTEKQKFDAGKYDGLLDQLGGAYREIRDRAQYVDEKVLRRLDDLEQRKSELEKELQGIEREDSLIQAAGAKKAVSKSAAQEQADRAAEQSRRKESLLREMDALMNDTDQLLREAQEKK